MFKFVIVVLCLFVSVSFAWPGVNNNINSGSMSYVTGETVDGYYSRLGFTFDLTIEAVIPLSQQPYLRTSGGNGILKCYFNEAYLSTPGTYNINFVINEFKILLVFQDVNIVNLIVI